jgi:hypothetical protein
LAGSSAAPAAVVGPPRGAARGDKKAEVGLIGVSLAS